MVEQRIRNAQVIGSSPMGGFFYVSYQGLLSPSIEIFRVIIKVYDCTSYEEGRFKKNLDFGKLPYYLSEKIEYVRKKGRAIRWQNNCFTMRIRGEPC